MGETIAAVLQDLTDMESGQRGFLLTNEDAYLKPYTDAKARIAGDFARLRLGLANRAENERSQEAQLEMVAAAKQAEMERTINLRQQGYRKRAFVMVNTNEGQGYMEQARGILSALNATEGERFAAIERQNRADASQAMSETVLVNFGLLVLTALLFALTRYHERALERTAAQSQRTLGARDLQLEKLTYALANQTRSEITIIEENVRWLIEKFEGFLPREGRAYAEQIREAAAQMERIRKDLVEPPDAGAEPRAA
jgi:CHASE3 domain sensor protein